MASAETPTPTLPYSSAGTFMTALDHLGSVGIPNIVDRSALPSSFSGSSKYELLGSLKYFELIDKDGKPDAGALSRLTDSATRTEELAALLKRKYPGLFDLPLSSASPSQIQQWFKDNATASTVGKAKAFFIALAKQTGIPMHSMVAKGTRAASGSVRRKRKPKKISALVGDATSDGEQSETPRRKETSTPGASRAVNLREGAGVVTLTVSVNLWDLEGVDRDFVFGLMDALKRYEKGETPAIGTK